MRALKHLPQDIEFVVDGMKDAFPHLLFKKEGNEFVGYENKRRFWFGRRQLAMIMRVFQGADSRSLVVRKYGFKPQDKDIFSLLGHLQPEPVLRRNHVPYEPEVQIASRFEVRYK